MKRLRFGIRSILILATIVALFMFVLLERRRYFREHVFITVLDSSSGIQLTQFQYRTWVITQDSPPWPEWSDWKTFQGDKPFAFKLPAYCKLHIEAKALGLPERFAGTQTTLLVVPEASHELTLRSGNSTPVTGSVVDDETNEPIEGVVVGPASALTMESLPTDWVTDSEGRFEIATTSPIKEIFAYHPRYQYCFATIDEPQPLRLRKGKSVRGRVVQSQTDQPVSDCSVEVWYANGVPLKQDERPADDAEVDNGTSARLRNVSSPRTAKTDANGEFELFLEPLSMNTQIRFRKKGWEDSYALANSPALSYSELKHGKFELSGQVVDDRGTPIPRFRVRAYVDDGSIAYREKEFNTSDGQFQIFSEKPWLTSSILADGYAPIYLYSKTRNAHELESGDLKLIRMSRGYRVTGTVERSNLHTKKVEVFLTNLRNGLIFDAGPPMFLKQHFESDTARSLRYQYESQLDSECSYAFNNLAPGLYALLVIYNGQTASLRPVVVESKDIEMDLMTLPPLGKVSGAVQEWGGNGEGRFTKEIVIPFLESQLQPFGVYYLKRAGDRWGKTFRTNHRGEFSFDHILIGDGEISAQKYEIPHGESFYMRATASHATVVNFPFVVRDTTEVTVSLDSSILCELEVEEFGDQGSNLFNTKALLHGPRESKAWMVPAKERSRNGLPIYEVHGPADLSTGQYTLDIRDGPTSLWLDFELERNHLPFRKRLAYRRVTANVADPSGWANASFLPMDVEVTLVKKSQAVTAFSIPFESDSPANCLIENADQYDVLFHDGSNGWALTQNVSFLSEAIDLGKIELKPGAQLSVKVSMQGLEVFPDEISVRHAETGKVFSQLIEDAYIPEQANSFGGLMPGKWCVEVTGRDPIAGKRRLFQRDIVIEGTAPVHLEFRKSE